MKKGGGGGYNECIGSDNGYTVKDVSAQAWLDPGPQIMSQGPGLVPSFFPSLFAPF